MKTILFQGDSITDVGRDRKDPDLGRGYPLLVSARLGADHPTEYSFVNRGISGNRIVDVYARIKADIINLKPDVMSILIGVNDVWHEEFYQNGVDNAKFGKIYGMLIEEIKAALPDIKIIILSPYLCKGHVTFDPEKPELWEHFSHEVALRAETSKRIARRYHLPFVDLQKVFDDAVASTDGDASYWTPDGVHPTFRGHELIAREWVKTFNRMK